MAFLVGGANSLTAGYDIDNSCRFNSGDSAYMHITYSGGASNLKTYTVSFWVKRAKLGARQSIFNNTDAGGQDGVYYDFYADDTLAFLDYGTGSYLTPRFETTQVFRDTSAWYHIVYAVDTTQSTEANRVKIYVNGTRVTAFDVENYPDEDADTLWNRADKLSIGTYTAGGNYFGGYLAEVVHIDGSQLAPTSFGEFDEDSGIWKPIDVSELTFGDNGFYLDFEDSGDLDDDESGEGNDFTAVNLAATDQTTDTPTNNFCTLNPLTARGSTGNTLAEGNLQYSAVAGAGDSSVFGTIGIPPGMKVYFEVKLVQNTAQNAVGIHNLYDCGDGEYCSGGSEVGTYSFKPRGAASVTQYFTDNDGGATNHDVNNAANDTILGVAIDNENGQIHYHLDGTYINSSDPTDNNPVALVTGFGGANEQYLHFSLDTSGTTEPINQYNFGNPVHSISSSQSDDNGYGNFEFDVPAGYYALCTKNLAKYG